MTLQVDTSATVISMGIHTKKKTGPSINLISVSEECKSNINSVHRD